jgi:hypothetical protein
MKITFTFFLLLTCVLATTAQTRVVSGRLLDTDGGSLPGVNVLIKNTTIGTTTDMDGRYTIEVPIGATLVFSFIGLTPREVVVTADNFKTPGGSSATRQARRIQLKPIPSSLFADSITKPTPGVATLDANTPTYRGETPNPATIRSIKRLGSRYMINTNTAIEQRTGFGLQLATTIGAESVTQLPALQNQYAQGRPQNGNFSWRGPDNQEIFSWGPLVRTLEYDGTSYPYDARGRLVPVGTGNGVPAHSYPSHSFFRTGWTTAHELTLMLPARGNGTFMFDLENRNQRGVIPNATYNKLNASATAKDYRVSKRVTANAKITYSRSTGNLVNHGANMATIVGSVYRTPATFNNTNEFSTRAIQPAAYQLPDGSPRSHAPLVADNPYGLAYQLPDRDELDRFIAMAGVRYESKKNFSLKASADVDHQLGKNVFGLPPGYAGYPSGRLTERQEAQTMVSAVITPSYKAWRDYGEFDMGLTYQANYTERTLARTDGFHFQNDSYGAGSLPLLRHDLWNQLSRLSHEATLNISQQFNNWLFIRLTNLSYFSNTLPSNLYTNLFPSAGIRLNLRDLVGLGYTVNQLSFYSTLSRTLSEAPLRYNNWSYGSTQLDMDNYASFYEATELYFNTALSPETQRKFEVGLNAAGLNGRVTLEMNYSNNRTQDFVAPQWTGSRYVLSNVATLRNYKTDISAEYTDSFDGGSWGVKLHWNKYSNMVDEVYGNTVWVPLAGFNTIQSVLAAGKPVGAIYGSGHQRDGHGRVVIDDAGFPIKDTQLRMLGSPIPDWTLALSSHLKLNKFLLTLVIDSRRGGQVWNGTRAALDYLGRSASTAALRNTGNYVFDGVTQQGTPNTQAVNFTDPNGAVTQNRWTRYGWDGVGEAYIEDASWLRLSEATLSYTLRRYSSKNIKEIKFQISGRNLLLFTGYNGVDPSSTLFGYATGSGLDLFNTPSVRNYSAQLTIKI